MISIKKFTFNPFQENTYILFDETKECVIIDPGCYEPHEEQELDQFITENELKPVKLISTHSHIDHVLGNKFVMDKYNVNLHIHEQDFQTLTAVETYAASYGFMDYKPCKEPTHFIKEGEDISFGNSKLAVRFVPGHAPGHVVFIAEKEKFVVNGDCLFYGSIGRTDLPGGDHMVLIDSIRKQLFTLPEDFVVYCGHGPETQIGFETQKNPFLQG
jgi:hydroxyacylglutathione hydrolase